MPFNARVTTTPLICLGTCICFLCYYAFSIHIFLFYVTLLGFDVYTSPKPMCFCVLVYLPGFTMVWSAA